MRYVFLSSNESYVFPLGGIQTVAWSRVCRGGRYVTGQTRVGPGAGGGPGGVA